jgi:hypothetical protein
MLVLPQSVPQIPLIPAAPGAMSPLMTKLRQDTRGPAGSAGRRTIAGSNRSASPGELARRAAR